MKSDLAEKLRSNLITQALIVVLCVTFTYNRRGEKTALDELETLYVSDRLLSATVGDVRNNDTEDKSAAPGGMASDLDTHMIKDTSVLEVDALAAFLANAKPGYHPPSHRIPLPSGGWLRFHSDRATYKELAPPPKDSKIPLYQLTIVVTEDADLHRPDEMRVVVTNAEESVDPVTKKKVWEPMKLRATVPHEDEPMGVADIENRIRIVAKKWGDSNSSPDSLYSSCRYSYENEQINIPVVNVQVSASLALVALSIVSTALAAYCTHQCRLSGESDGSEPHRGFLILRPIDGTVPPGFWHQVLAHGEVLLIQPPYWIGLLAPMICSGLLAIVHAGIGYSWSGWVLLPFGIAYTWLMAQAIVGVSWNRTDAKSAE